MDKKNFLIYGSYGYSGNLIAELACNQGLKPVLAGRNKQKLQDQAKKLNLEYKVFDLSNLEETKQSIQPFTTVIHCAGPFINTYKNMVQACIETNTHYMDITGEYDVIEKIMQLDKQAQAANIMLLPATGFDVVPSDCLAQHLKTELPDANQLLLAINTTGSGGISQGTAKTFVENLGKGSMVRDDGILKPIPFAWKKRLIDFGNHKPRVCTTISWGDLSSAWWSTRIPHIETYMATPPKMLRIYKLINPIKKIFNWAPVKRFLQNRINKLPEGPTDDELKHSTSQVYGEVMNANGMKKSALVQVPNGYAFTALSVILIVKKTLEGNAPVGFQTPSTAYTKDLVLEVPGTSRVDL